MTVPCGLDVGNRRTKIHLLGKSASIPSTIGFEKPIVLGKNDTEIKPKAFSLLFRVRDGDKISDHELWFGQDVLACQNTMQGLDQIKYNKSFLQRLFQGALYEWSRVHKYDLNQLEKLSIVTSMPPGQYQKASQRNKANKAYNSAFNTGKSHMKIRPLKGESIQIVTQFSELTQEAVLFGSMLERKSLSLILDLGGGTTDIVIFNGSINPIYKKTFNNGFITVYEKTNPIDPEKVELKILTNKSAVSDQLISYYNTILNLAVKVIRQLPQEPDEINIIGGPAARMPSQLQSQFKSLADKVFIRDQYVNAIANWKRASERM